MTPLGKLLVATETELAVFAPLTVTSTVPGVPSCGATTVLVESDTVSGPGGVPGPLMLDPAPPQPVVKTEAASTAASVQLSRNRNGLCHSHHF